jgi:hypothetical protein
MAAPSAEKGMEVWVYEVTSNCACDRRSCPCAPVVGVAVFANEKDARDEEALDKAKDDEYSPPTFRSVYLYVLD